jgi:hypothetical protein
VREIKSVKQEIFMPKVHQPGAAQVIWGTPWQRSPELCVSLHFFVMMPPHSDAFFVMAFELACMKTYPMKSLARSDWFFQNKPDIG